MNRPINVARLLSTNGLVHGRQIPPERVGFAWTRSGNVMSIPERAPVDIKDLKYFAMAYEQRGFLRASERLNTVQSNVSARIKKLEEHFGTKLFKRLYRGVRPTPAAVSLYPDAKRLVEMAESLERKARESVGTGRDNGRSALKAASVDN